MYVIQKMVCSALPVVVMADYLVETETVTEAEADAEAGAEAEAEAETETADHLLFDCHT